MLVLLSLVHSGDITLRLVGKEAIDASSLADAGKKPVEDFCKFRHVERPKDIPLSSLVALFELVGLPEGIIRDPNTRDDAIRQLHEKTSAVVKRVVVAKQHAQSGLPCWGHELIPMEKRDEYRQKLDALQDFLEKLQAFNTPGKLKNFSASVDEVKAYCGSLGLLGELEAAHSLVGELTPLTSYLTTAGAVLPTGDSWIAKSEKLCNEWQPQLRNAEKRRDPGFRQKLVQAIEKCKKEFQDHYLALHKKSRLGVNEEEKKNKLEKDQRLDRLGKLAGISVLSHSTLTELRSRLDGLKPCYKLDKSDLNANPVCPHCGFRPSDEKGAATGAFVLDAIDEEIDKLLDSWADTILSDLGDPTVSDSIELLDEVQKNAVKMLIKDGGMPKKISTELVQGIQSALSGLTQINVKPGDLLNKLSGGSASCTVKQFQKRFEEFVTEITRGKVEANVRIVLDQPQGNSPRFAEDD